MSTVVYGALTRKREEASPGTSKAESPPGVASFVDSLAALVPAEVLSLHAVALAVTTQTATNGAGEPVTTITQPALLRWTFVGLIVFCFVFYFVGHRREEWDRWDFARMLVPAVAFVGWTMAQRATAFDAVWPGLSDPVRSVVAAFGAVGLALIAGALADAADRKVPLGAGEAGDVGEAVKG